MAEFQVVSALTEEREAVPKAVWVKEVGLNWVLQNGSII